MSDPDAAADPIPAEGAPHAYVVVQRTHSVNADRPEWAAAAYVISEHDHDEIAFARARGRTLLPIGPDGDTGTCAIVEEFRPAEVEWTYVDPIVQQAIKTATTSIKDGNGDSVYSRDNLADAIQLLVAAIQILDRPSDGE